MVGGPSLGRPSALMRWAGDRESGGVPHEMIKASCTRWLPLVVGCVVLTFGFAVVDGVMPGSLFTVTSVWTSLVLAGYLVYTRRAGRPLSPLWTFPVRRWSMGLATLTVAAVTLAIAMPPGERTHADLLRITFIAVVGEELVFRGLVWDIVETAARRITSSPDRLTVILTGSLFALSHAQYHDFRPSAVMAGQIGYTLVAGLVLGWARLRSRGLPVPILIHATGNALLKLA